MSPYQCRTFLEHTGLSLRQLKARGTTNPEDDSVILIDNAEKSYFTLEFWEILDKINTKSPPPLPIFLFANYRPDQCSEQPMPPKVVKKTFKAVCVNAEEELWPRIYPCSVSNHQRMIKLWLERQGSSSRPLVFKSGIVKFLGYLSSYRLGTLRAILTMLSLAYEV